MNNKQTLSGTASANGIATGNKGREDLNKAHKNDTFAGTYADLYREQNNKAEAKKSSRFNKVFECNDCHKKFHSKVGVEYHTFKTGHLRFNEKEKLKKPYVVKKNKNIQILDKQNVHETFQKVDCEGFSQQLPSATCMQPQAPSSQNNSTSKAMAKLKTSIQIRLLDGSTLQTTFDVRENFISIRRYVNTQIDSKQKYNLITAFPRRVFTQNDNQTSLIELGLLPAVVLIMTKPSV